MTDTITTSGALAQCPAWCTTNHSTNSDPKGRVHVRVVGSQNAELTGSVERGHLGDPTIYLTIAD